jgi:hypothetical protein
MTLSAVILVASSLVAGPPTPIGGFISFPASWANRVDGSRLSQRGKEIYYADLWRKQITDLKTMHFDTLILQYTSYDLNLYFEGNVNFESVPVTSNPAEIESRALNVIMKQAEASRFNVWVGLRQRGAWNNEN